MAGPNIYSSDLDTTEREGFSHRDAQVGRDAGAERLGASVYELEPGNATFPYPIHLANEEMLLVLRGRPHLRTPAGWRQLEEGEVVAFPVGERGAHQIANRSDGPVRFLVISEMNGPEVVLYPDSGKIGARECAPGTGAGLRESFHSADAVDYWDGERP